MIVAAFLWCAGVEIDATAVSQRRDRRWELSLQGRVKGIPDGAILTLRFRRIESAVRWKDRAILTEVCEPPWLRKVTIERHAFAYAELLPSPCELQVEILFLPDDQEAPELRKSMGMDYRPHRAVRVFRAGRAQDTGPLLRKDHDAFRDRTDEARKILQALVSAEDRAELSKRKRELERLLGKVRDEPSLLAGSVRALGSLLQDLYNSVGTIPKSETRPKSD